MLRLFVLHARVVERFIIGTLKFCWQKKLSKLLIPREVFMPRELLPNWAIVYLIELLHFIDLNVCVSVCVAVCVPLLV